MGHDAIILNKAGLQNGSGFEDSKGSKGRQVQAGVDWRCSRWLSAACSPRRASRADVDARKTAEAAMLKADRDFNQAMADRDMSRFLSFVAEDATFDASRGRGRTLSARRGRRSSQPDGPTLSLGADEGRSARRRRRRLHRSARGSAGRRPPTATPSSATHGQYLTVWQKQKDGTWQATFDTGSTAP